MNVKFFIKRLLTNSCIYFSIIMVLYALVTLVMNVNDDEVLLDAGRVLLFYVFALLFAAANSIKEIKALHKAVAILLHYAITAFAFYACFFLPINMTPSNVFIGLAIYTVAYVIVSVIMAVFKARFRANAEVKQDYKPQFKAKK